MERCCFRRGTAYVAQFRNSKIEHLNTITAEAIRLQPDVVGFQVPVNDALLMRFMHRGANLFKNVDYPVKRKSLLFGQHVTQRTPVQIFHDEISNSVFTGPGKAKVSHIDHVRMSKTTGCPRFAPEAFDKFLVAHKLRHDQLESDETFRAEVRRQVDCAHAALSKQALQAILLIQSLTDVRIDAVHSSLQSGDILSA